MLPAAAPSPAASDALELARLERLVADVRLPSPLLPGWQSLTALEYAAAVHELTGLLGTIAAALAAARAAA